MKKSIAKINKRPVCTAEEEDSLVPDGRIVIRDEAITAQSTCVRMVSDSQPSTDCDTTNEHSRRNPYHFIVTSRVDCRVPVSRSRQPSYNAAGREYAGPWENSIRDIISNAGVPAKRRAFS